MPLGRTNRSFSENTVKIAKTMHCFKFWLFDYSGSTFLCSVRSVQLLWAYKFVTQLIRAFFS